MNYKHLGIILIVVTALGMLIPIIPVAAPTTPVVDGVISPGEYAGGMAVTLVGPYPAGAPFPAQTVDAYIEWDLQFLYVAVNEPVPTLGGGTNDWIEFCFDAGPHRSFLDAFVLFGSGQLQYVKCPKPPGGWGWDTWPHTWWAATGVATEFKFDYTDFGIAFGDTIKMVIDRGRNAPSNPPLGDCVIWPFTATFYPPQPIDPTTWGDVGLNGGPPPPPPTHVVDGVIGSVEYAGGMAVTLVGRTDSSWTVDAYIDWDTEYLYVAVNEPVPPGGTGLDWIEFCFDAGPHRSFLDAFVLFGSGSKTHVQCPKPPGSWATTPWPYTWWAATGVATEFKFDYTDFGITIGDTIKMSIDRNDGSAPTPPPHYTYGFAAFWPSSAQVYSPGPPDPTTWGDVYLAPPPPSVSLTVVSAYDAPNPSGTTSYTPGTSVTASVTSPVAGPTGYRYVCTGWTGTGDVPSSGTGTTVTFTINQDSGITWNWKTQTYLTVKTDPPGIATIPGEGWYDLLAYVTLTAPPVPGYVFSYWDYNGVSQGSGVNPITVQVKCVATAHYCYTTQYYLTVGTDPSGLKKTGGDSPTSPPSGWFDECTCVTLMAEKIAWYNTTALDRMYTFYYWRIDGQRFGENTITIHMDANHTAIAVYVRGPIDPIGDVDYDSHVDIVDLTLISKYFGRCPRDSEFHPGCDINKDGIIDIIDLSAAAKNFGFWAID